MNQRLADPAPGQIDAILHNDAFALIAQRPQIFRSPTADGPDFVAGIDVFHQGALTAFLKHLGVDEIRNIHIELGVIGHDQGHIQYLPEFPTQHGGDNGTVAVQQRRLVLGQLPHNLRRKGNARHISGGHAAQIQGRIAQNREGIASIVRAGIFRGDDNGIVPQCMKVFPVIQNRIGHAVNDRGEGIIQKANRLQYTHPCLSKVCS